MNELAVDQGRPNGDSTAMMATATLPTDVQARAEGLYRQAVAIRVSSDVDYELAAGFVADIKAAFEQLDKDRVRLKKPFLDGTRGIDDYFRTPIARGEEAIRKVKDAMIEWDKQKRIAQELEERRLAEVKRKADAEAREREKAAQERIRAEEQAKREAAEAREREERSKREAAEATERRERARREAAEAQAKGIEEAAKAAEKRAQAAEEEAAKAREQSRLDREAAIEARRRQLKAEDQTAAAVATMDTAQAEAQAAGTAAAIGPDELHKVSGVARKRVWKFRLVTPIDKVPMRYHCLDTDKVQEVVDRLKDLAGETLGECFEVYFEDELAVGRGRKK